MTKNNIISELSQLCSKHPRLEKLLIIPDYSIGHQILEHLTRSGVSWINFRLTTVNSLAMELVEDDITERQLEYLPPVGIKMVVDGIFSNLAGSGKLKYFQKHSANKGIVAVLSMTISELRLNEIMSGNIKPGCFISKAKENDIRLILSEYEKILKEKKLIDKAGLIMLALEQIKKEEVKTEEMYLIFSGHYLRGIEREFVKKFCKKNLIIVNEDQVYGLEPPSDTWKSEEKVEPAECKTNIERLKWLFNTREAPPPFKDKTIEIFSAVGCRNEAREVIRRISAGKNTVDNVEIIYTDEKNYGELIYTLCEKLHIPVTFSEGINAYLTVTGRTMMGFLLWMKEDFGESYLRGILEAGGLKWKTAEDANSPGETALGFLLRTAGVGWGRARYALVLGKRIEECIKNSEEARDEGDEEKAVRYENNARSLDALKGICENLLSLVPVPDEDGKIEFKKICAGCINFLESYVRISGENDSNFAERAKRLLAMLGRFLEGKMVFDEAVERLINTLSAIKVGASGPKAGYLHVSHYKEGGKSGRGMTFIVGLDESKFPEKAVQDPILLDEERENFARDLELSKERLKKSIYCLAALMASLRGKVVVSYSSYDIKEERRAFPSSLVLQVFRIKEGNPTADYNMLFKALGEPVGYSYRPNASLELDETDWWLNRLVEGGLLKDGMEPIKVNYQGVKEGLRAREARESDIFTEYDGKVTPEHEELDPRENKNLVMSASMIETAAKCPFGYFIRYVLKVSKPEEMEKEATEWLNALERGSLLHEVFKEFVEHLREEGCASDMGKQKSLIEKILGDIVKRYKEDIPPPSEVVFQNEYTQLKRDVNVFLQINEELGTRPVQCEMSFGARKEKAIEVPIGEGKSILLRGKIDRIDNVEGSEYHVWDYKTGSAYSYDESGYVAGGEQVQHILYAVAAKEILRKKGKDPNAVLTTSGYLLPTEKGTKDGKGGIFRRFPGEQDIWQGALSILLGLIGGGNFIVNTKDVCKFCDYEDICGGEKTREQMKFKLDRISNHTIISWKKLKEYA